MNIVSSLVAGWGLAAGLMLVLWAVQRRRGNAGIVDVAWAFATGLLGVGFAWVGSGDVARRVAIAVMAGLWGLRLGAYLFKRVGRQPEDGRYQHLRGEWGAQAQRNLFVFFQVQALWAVMFAAPMLAGAANPRPFGWLDALGVLIWLAALGGESIADQQLARFKARAADKARVCRDGLWRYSRHPNYFFEWLHWWAYVCLAAGSPLWWIAAAGVVVMWLFLTRVTGIPPTEAQALRSRGEAYREYQRTTSAFVPWPPTEEGSQ
ncbi:MAG: DUF1295 domain-containing protein [Vicinamibacterales bacterium]